MMLRYKDSHADGIGIVTAWPHNMTNATSSSLACFCSRNNLTNHNESQKDDL